MKMQLEAVWRVESPKRAEASLSADSQLSPHEKRIYVWLKPNVAQLDELTESLEGKISSSEIFSARLERELAALPEKLRQPILMCLADKPLSRRTKRTAQRQAA
ncbi:MAG TPA: hypothetical protein VG498_24740 [Terriglobales bacterium]|nr:hypothetical protein [Terriglobales bacterium]